MSARTSASRYAKALFDVAVKESDPATIERDLAEFVNAMSTHADLQRALTSPATPPAARLSVVQALATKAALQAPVAKLIALLAERGRLELLPHVLAVYRERLRAEANIVRATVTSATPLAPERVKALEQQLSQVTGKNVELDAAVDPAIIGGVITQIGSTVYDGSFRTQLEKMRQRLVERV